MAIFAHIMELYWKYHRTSRLKFVWKTVWEQLSLWLSQAAFSEPHKPSVLPTGPDRLARCFYKHGWKLPKCILLWELPSWPARAFTCTSAHHHTEMTYEWLCQSRQLFHSMLQSNFQFGYQSYFHIFFVTLASWRVFHLLQEDSKAALCLHTANIRRHLSLLYPTCKSLEASASVLHEDIKHTAHNPCTRSLINTGHKHLLMSSVEMEISHVEAQQNEEKYV